MISFLTVLATLTFIGGCISAYLFGQSVVYKEMSKKLKEAVEEENDKNS